MEKDLEVIVDDEIAGIFITYQGNPIVVISTVNEQGWRQVLVDGSEFEPPYKELKSIERFIIEELNMKQNNDARNWSWKEEKLPFTNKKLFSVNLRNADETNKLITELEQKVGLKDEIN